MLLRRRKNRTRARARRRTLVSRNSTLALRGVSPLRPGLLRAVIFLVLLGVALNYLWQWAPAVHRWTAAAIAAPWLKQVKTGPVASKKTQVSPLERKPLAFIAGNRVLGMDRAGVVFSLPKGQFFDLPFLSFGGETPAAGDTLLQGKFALQVLAVLTASPSPLFTEISEVRIAGDGGVDLIFPDSKRRVRMSGENAAGAVEDLRRVLAQPGLFVRGTLFVGYKNVAFLSQEEG